MATSVTADPASLTIVHATDLRPEGGAAFAHAVALAREMNAVLYSLHASETTGETRPMPRAADLQDEWQDQRRIIHHTMAHTYDQDPVEAMLDFVGRTTPDLVIVGTAQQRGLKRMFHGSVSEAVARNVDVPTLFIPLGGRGFVGPEGQLALRSVVLPVSGGAVAAAALRALEAIVVPAGLSGLQSVVLHAGPGEAPELSKLASASNVDVQWRSEQRGGDLTSAVLACVEEHGADLVIMPTRGQDSLGDMLKGSHTEQIVRRAPCPVLSVPLRAQSG